MNRNCTVCQKSFLIKTWDKTRAKYCSKACQKIGCRSYDKTLPSHIQKVCPNCQTSFTVSRSQSRKVYCNRACKKQHWLQIRPGLLNLKGQKFGRLTVISYAGKPDGAHTFWLCECSCQAKTRLTVRANQLRTRGENQGCGCIVRGEGIPKPEKYTCSKCNVEFPYTEEFFMTNRVYRWNLSPQCKNCHYSRVKISHKTWRDKLKLEVLSHYSKGEPKCECCGVTGIWFLTLDHINNDGKEDRKTHGGSYFYSRLKKLGYPPHVRTMCFNCNIARSQTSDGKCPHEHIGKIANI